MSSTTPKLNPPFRADHIGSLKRPAKLLQKRKELDDGKTTRAELKVVEDDAIRNIIQMQRETGIKSITDGEFRRCACHFSLSCFGGGREGGSAWLLTGARGRHMFYDGVFDNLDGMKFVSPGESCHL